MHAPVSMLTGPGNSKAFAVVAVLIGLLVVTKMQHQQAYTPSTAR